MASSYFPSKIGWKGTSIRTAAGARSWADIGASTRTSSDGSSLRPACSSLGFQAPPVIMSSAFLACGFTLFGLITNRRCFQTMSFQVCDVRTSSATLAGPTFPSATFDPVIARIGFFHVVEQRTVLRCLPRRAVLPAQPVSPVTKYAITITGIETRANTIRSLRRLEPSNTAPWLAAIEKGKMAVRTVLN